ncbi:MAG TPA: hypothetical protein DCZ95_13140 [Verrucomicrobia bacterium]|nr:MAG: hypothetical protein A2X46_11525 [Lentisphaerae bacterium GWF2_57_35]HBA85032.1 hypothetical protein [Verrucomicrobiota bacterium]
MYDEDDLKLLLGGKHEEQEQGIETLCETYSKPLWSFLLKRFPGLRHEDVGEIVSDTFIAVWRRIEKGTFDLNQPFAKFVFTVAKNKAIDQLRKYKTQIGDTIDDDIGVVAERIQNTEAGYNWHSAVSYERAAAIQDTFIKFIRTLPDVQRQVAQVMADNFPDELGQDETTHEIYRRTGKRPTIASIKRARTEIRQKFKEYLTKNHI